MNGAVAVLRFFFTKTCNRPEMARHLTVVRQPQKLPVVLTLEEVAPVILYVWRGPSASTTQLVGSAGSAGIGLCPV
jgi:hypothetical protein